MVEKISAAFRSLMRLGAVLGSVSDRFRPRDHHPEQPGPIGLLAIMKNESLNIREWLDHYRWQGVDRIFLIDNGSTEDMRALMKEEIASGFVEYFWRPEEHRQKAHYREVFDSAEIKKKVNWLVLADLDEFWFSPLGSIRKALEFIGRDADLIYTNWRIFGSGDFESHPKSLRKDLLYRNEWLERHEYTKWICRTSRIVTSAAIDVHKVRWVDSRRVASDNELLRVNHYVTQSLQYFTEVKMNRGDAANVAADKVRDMQYFYHYNKGAVVFDRSLCDLLTGVQAPAVLNQTAL